MSVHYGYPHYITSGTAGYNTSGIQWSGASASGNIFSYQTTVYDGSTGGSGLNVIVKAVLVKAGYLGQVVHLTASGTNEVVWESKPKKTHDKALKAANKAKDTAVARLFEEN